jgi:hypothetical protein
MLETIGALARRSVERRRAVLALVDARRPARSARGAEVEELVQPLAWLEDDPDVTVLRQDCGNGFVGGIEAVHHGTHGATRNRVVDWVNAHRLGAVVVTGAYTDAAVMDFVVTMLAARDHGLMPTLRDIVVLEPATAAHPKLPTHHMALYFMASRGAVLAGELTGA